MGQLSSKIFSLFRSRKPQGILMVGLDSAGKTSILYKLKDNIELTTVPTIGFNLEECTISNTKLRIWDVGGQEKIRHLWPTYFENTNGLVYVIDINCLEKFDEAIFNFKRITEERNVPVLILLNKKDLVLNDNEGPSLQERENIILDKVREFLTDFTYKIFVICAKPNEVNADEEYLEIVNAFTWLSKEIQKIN
ncbi:ADP-ribosylation factor 6 [Tubulinosema ratisbonensis]|uniref:ADP-ribosylation factor n=1 Tax=Tubulinosema ratisbonensis TaxID=291195 RepID=A0A437ANE1_9MICR|nr:ADP-ribosylation factor 6 [Tubulinosema ratisbonensis]